MKQYSIRKMSNFMWLSVRQSICSLHCFPEIFYLLTNKQKTYDDNDWWTLRAPLNTSQSTCLSSVEKGDFFLFQLCGYLISQLRSKWQNFWYSFDADNAIDNERLYSLKVNQWCPSHTSNNKIVRHSCNSISLVLRAFNTHVKSGLCQSLLDTFSD